MGALKPYLAVFIMQLIYSGLTLLSKTAFNGRMNTCVFIFYRQLTGTVIMAPLALILERFTLALNLQAIALVYTSAMSAAIVNSLPATTFFFAVMLRMEKVNIRTKSGITKIGNVLLCLVGVATLVAFYKAPQLRTEHHILSRYHNHQSLNHKDHFSSGKRWLLGSLLLFLGVIMWSFWLTNQGALVTGVSYYLQAWVIEKRGPFFQVMWNPLSFILATTGSILFLGEPLRLGRVLRGILLVLSLDSVLWAKSKEAMTYQNSLPVKE